MQTVDIDSLGLAPTLIKMDIESAELAALRGAKNCIKKHRPRLAICIYHRPEDLSAITSYILSLHSDYRLFLRNFYSTSVDVVMFAV